MSIGPGKYDDLCTMVREQTIARAAIVIIIGGKDGPGFSVQSHDPRTLRLLPALLRDVAGQIEADVGREHG